MKKIYITEEQLINFAKNLLEESIHKDIDNSINSNLSISPEVERKTEEISNIIANKINKTIYKKFNEIEYSTFGLESDFISGKTISFAITNYNFKDKEQFNLLKDKYYNILNSSKMSYDGKSRVCFMWINTCSINYKLYKLISNDNLQHEISHFYQDIKFNGFLPNDDYYSIAYSNLNKNNELIRNISTLIYYSYNFEQDGYINGLNQFIKNCEHNKPFLEWEDIKQSNTYKILEQFRYIKNSILNYDIEEIKNIIRKNFNLSYNDFINLINTSEKRFLSKIGRVFYRHRKKCLENGLRINEGLNNNVYLTFY